MAMFEWILDDSLFIDFGSEIIYGTGEQCICCPRRFATVEFELMSTPLLCMIADRMRKNEGYTPLNPMDEFTEETCDGDGWYDFYIGVSDLYDGAVDTSIAAIVCNSSSPDEGELYSIELSQEEQGYIYCRLDEQCRTHLGKSLEDLLKESRETMDEYAKKGFTSYSFLPFEAESLKAQTEQPETASGKGQGDGE